MVDIPARVLNFPKCFLTALIFVSIKQLDGRGCQSVNSYLPFFFVYQMYQILLDKFMA